LEEDAMRIGIVPVLNRHGGGAYQYSETLVRTLFEARSDPRGDEFVVFADGPLDDSLVASFRGRPWKVKSLWPQTRSQEFLDLLRHLVGEGPHREAWKRVRNWVLGGSNQPGAGTPKEYVLPPPPANLDQIQFRPELNRWFRRCGIDLMLYPIPNRLSFEAGIPFVMAIHDLQHRLQPEFPEVSDNNEWEWREYCFRNAARSATLVLADSEVGKEDILRFYGAYGITADRVKVLPFLPAHYLTVEVAAGDCQRVRASYGLPERYLFYPAQFWPH
jgi:hypothetical protein